MQLTSQTRMERLTGLAFSAGELPVTFEMRALESSREQHTAVAFDHGRRDDDRRHLREGPDVGE